MSSFVRFGGSGGRVEGSKTGALTLLQSNEAFREPGALGAPIDSVDIVEMVEETDSFEAFLLSCCWDGFRGGNAGDGWVEGFLCGSLGGCTDVAFWGCSIF